MRCKKSQKLLKSRCKYFLVKFARLDILISFLLSNVCYGYSLRMLCACIHCVCCAYSLHNMLYVLFVFVPCIICVCCAYSLRRLYVLFCACYMYSLCVLCIFFAYVIHIICVCYVWQVPLTGSVASLSPPPFLTQYFCDALLKC